MITHAQRMNALIRRRHARGIVGACGIGGPRARAMLVFRRSRSLAVRSVEPSVRCFVTVAPVLNFHLHGAQTHFAPAAANEKPSLSQRRTPAPFMKWLGPLATQRSIHTPQRHVHALVGVVTPAGDRPIQARTDAGMVMQPRVQRIAASVSKRVSRDQHLLARFAQSQGVTKSRHEHSTERPSRLLRRFAPETTPHARSATKRSLPPAGSFVTAEEPNPTQAATIMRRRAAALHADAPAETYVTPPWAHAKTRVQLVWRKGQVETAAAGERTAQAVPTPATNPVTFVTAPVASEHSPVSRPMRSAATAYDGAMVDRLTDDVIRKIERRVRIERERQGL